MSNIGMLFQSNEHNAANRTYLLLRTHDLCTDKGECFQIILSLISHQISFQDLLFCIKVTGNA